MVMETAVNETTQYAVNLIQEEINRKIFGMLIKFMFILLASIGASIRDLKQVRVFLVAAISFLGVWEIINAIQLARLFLLKMLL